MRLISDDPENVPDPQDPALEIEHIEMGQSVGLGLAKIEFISRVISSFGALYV